MFGGGGSSSSEAAQPAAENNNVASQNAGGYGDSNWGAARSCEADAKSFTQCLDQNGGNMQICGWYLDQLVCFSFLFFSFLTGW